MSTVTPSRPPLPPPGSPRPRSSAGAATRGIDPFRILRRHLTLFVATGFVGIVLGCAAFYVLFKWFPR